MTNTNVPQKPSLTLICVKTMHGSDQERAEAICYGVNEDRMEALKKLKASEMLSNREVKKVRFFYVATAYYLRQVAEKKASPLTPEMEII